MIKSSNRGRPIDNDQPLLKYTQTFKDHYGVVTTWEYDKTKFPYGPISVTIKDPAWSEYDKLENKLSSILQKYEVKDNQRKPRITKVDKAEIERIEKELDEIFYSFYPEDRPKVRKNSKKK